MHHEGTKEGTEREGRPLDVLAWFVAVFLGGAGIALAVRAATSSNHWGVDVRPAALVYAAAALAGATGWRRSFLGGPAALALLAAGLLGGGVLHVLDRFNLLVEVGLWIRRGMPGPWES